METILLLSAALAAGYLGGYLALTVARRQDKAELRGAVDELLSELTFAAEQSCEQIIDQRRKLEHLVGSLQENRTMALQAETFSDNNFGEKQAHETMDYMDYVEAPAGQGTHDARSEMWNRVMTMARQGKSSAEIAKELNVGLGEVDLVLSLASRQD